MNTIKSNNHVLKSLLSGTALLTLSTLITKIIGLFYKIPLIKYVGIEGMAYFLAANHIYVFLFVVSTSGLPVALSILISEAVAKGDDNNVRELYRRALNLFLWIGSFGSSVMFFGASLISKIINISGSTASIMAISPAVLAACICGAVRGYFQGRQIMVHTAVSQIIEAAGKLGLGILGAAHAVKCGYNSNMVAAYAIFGITAGMIVSMAYLLIVKSLYDKKYILLTCSYRKCRGTTKKLLLTAFPITLSSAVISLSSITDTALIANRLNYAGFSENTINTLYSCYGNIAVPLFSLIPSLISPIAMVAVPIIASLSNANDNNETMQNVVLSSLQFTMFVAIPASLGLSVFSKEIISLIFPDNKPLLNTAAPLLSFLSLAVISACLITITNAILQSCGKANKTIVSMVIGVFVKAGAEYMLVSTTKVNIFGAPLSTLLCNIIVVCLNILFLTDCISNIKLLIVPFLKISVSAVIAVIIGTFVSDFLFIDMFEILIIVIVVVILYVLLCMSVNVFDKNFNIIVKKNKGDVLKNDE